MAVKVNRGGKRSKELFGKGEYGKDIAGQRHELKEKEWGTKREFKGSTSQEFTFYSKTRGTITIRATSYEEALRLAKRRGYSRRRYGRRK